eukprot:TRINITY_DN494_c0_g2_i7.p2 TRINITY_DN494_c0_g2~~TRINITY_DN494_c0_g2_i7.p2  ORF type:complete len:137 (+),score=18.10 TRINITY_DN494_c0_g2_i7:268-678(+)
MPLDNCDVISAETRSLDSCDATRLPTGSVATVPVQQAPARARQSPLLLERRNRHTTLSPLCLPPEGCHHPKGLACESESLAALPPADCRTHRSHTRACSGKSSRGPSRTPTPSPQGHKVYGVKERLRVTYRHLVVF